MKASYEQLLGQYRQQIENLNVPNSGLVKLLFLERAKGQSDLVQDLQSERVRNFRSAHEAAIALSVAMQSPLQQTKSDFKTAISLAARRGRE